MRIVETKVYHVNELSDEAKENAISNLCDINVDHDWWDYDGLLDLTEKEMKSRRIKYMHPSAMKNVPGYYPSYTGLFKYDEIYFDIDRNWHLHFKNLVVQDDDTFRKFLRIPKRLWANTYYSFYNIKERYATTSIEFEEQNNELEFTDKQQEILDRAKEIFDDKVQEALVNLRESYEYLTGDEAIMETIEANEYEFTADGLMA